MTYSLIIGSLTLLTLDAVYLYVNRQVFSKQIEKIQRVPMRINIQSVILCYIFILVGIYYFIWRNHCSPKEAAILGLIIYGVYDTTTVALFKDWSWKLAAIDVLWGAVLFGASTWVYNYSFKRLGK